jgi:putative transposase
MSIATPLLSTNHSVYTLYYHLVLVTKYRRRVLSLPMQLRLRTIATDTAVRWGGQVREANGEPDHVHFLLTLPPQVAPSVFVNNLKTVTSRLLRRDFPGLRGAYRGRSVLWSPSYCILSAGGAPLEILKRYIQQQEAEPRRG